MSLTPSAALEAIESATTPFDAARVLVGALVRAAQFVGFWTAVALPPLYVPLLVFGVDLSTFAGLLGANALGLLVGRGYRR
jgi:hypothetical protein